MKKIVIITYNMVPYASSWGACQRMYFLARKLTAMGHQVKVFALNTANYNTYGKEMLPNVVHFSTPQQSMSNQDATKTPTGQSGIKDIKLLRSIFHGTDSIFFNEIIPGTGIKAYKNCKRGREKIEEDLRQKHYDTAIISGPPFTVFSYIKTVKEISPATKIIMDYRDPWNSWYTGNPITTRREKKLQQLADLIVCTNDELCDDMSAKFHIPRDKYSTVSNGYMSSVEEVLEDIHLLPKGKLNIVYTGTINFGPYCEPYRDSKNLLQAVRQLITDGVEDFCITFVGIGNTEAPEIIKIKEELGDTINFVGVVSSSKANLFVKEADVALVMHTANDNSGRFLISGKVYDYIHNKKFMLSIGRNDAQHAIILNKYHIGINAVNEVKSIKTAIQKCLDLWRNQQLNAEYQKIDITKFSRDYQIDRYSEIIDGL